MEQKDGFLTISPTGRQISDEENAEVVLAERTVSGTYTAATKIDIANLSNEESAGLSVYGWRTTAVGISFRNGKISTWQREGGKQKEFASVDIPQDTKNVLLRIKVVSGEVFRFSFSTNGVDWHELGDKITASYIEGARIALIYDGRISNSGAHFDWFHLESK